MVARNSSTVFDEALVNQKVYWEEKLSGELMAHGLPVDFNRPQLTAESEWEVFTFQFEEELGARLLALSRRNNLLLFSVLIAGVKICLHQYSHADDILVATGIPKQHEHLAILNDLLMLRDELPDSLSLRELLVKVKTTLAEAYENQKYPVESILNNLVASAPNYPPLCKVMVLFDGVTVTPANAWRKSETMIVFQVCESRLSANTSFNTRIFTPETIGAFVDHLEHVLTQIVENPERKIGEVKLISPDRQARLAETSRGRTAAWTNVQTIHQLFEHQAAQCPFHIALQCGDQSWDYQELNHKANQLARYLQTRGVKAETKIAVCLDHSCDLVMVLLAILKAGAAYVPLDPLHPPRRLEYILRDSRAALLISQKKHVGALEETGIEVLCLQEHQESIAAQAGNDLGIGHANSLAYVIYTSGSTGQPKGVEVEHSALVNYILWARDAYFESGKQRSALALYSSVAFDLTVTSIYLPLITGSRICIYPSDGSRYCFNRMMQEKVADCIKLTPSHLRLLDPGEPSEPWVKRFIVGGEALATDLAGKIAQAFPGARIFNEYGPTEATVGCMLYEFDRHRDKRRFVPIGRAAANQEVYVLDAQMEVAAENVAGELFIGGAGLARGYSNRPELTAEKFVPNPFCRQAGGRLYRTGDLARYLPDGNIEFLGRKDEQVKFHGYRVELNEIRCAINEFPQVRESLINVVKDSQGNDVMVAYYVARQEVAGNRLRAFLGERIIAELIPNYFIHLKRMPLTLNGKVNYEALPGFEEVRQSIQRETIAPRTPVEEVVAAIWTELLGLEKAGIDDNFFDLGGHSLLTAPIISRVRRAFGVDIPISSVFEAPTLAEFSAQVEAALGSGQIMPASPIAKAPRNGRLPLSYAQQRLWILDLFETGNDFYNQSFLLELKGALEVAALKKSFNDLGQRHEILRTSFVALDGEPVQHIESTVDIDLPVVSLAHLRREHRKSQLEKLAIEESRKPFDLGKLPLLRAMLVKMEEQEHVLVLTIHHIVIDEWSLGILLEELGALYGANRGGDRFRLSDLSIQYADYSVWQREWLNAEMERKLLGYWIKQLEGVPQILELPTDRPRPARPTYRGQTENRLLSPVLWRELKKVARRESATTFMTLLAAFEVLLMRYTGQKDFAIGAPVANRPGVETERLIGFFLNMLVLRAELDQANSLRGVVEMARKVALGAYAHQDLPFEKIVEKLAPQRDLSRTPMFQVVFTFRTETAFNAEFGGLQMNSLNVDVGTSKYDLTLSVQPVGESAALMLNYSTDLFNADTITKMLGHYERLLEHMASETGRQRLWDLPMLSREEENQLVWQYRPVNAGADGKTITELFEEQVAMQPQAAAVAWGEDQLSYSELNERANQLGRHLRSKGIGAEDRIGICVERSLDLVVGILGILKAGAAYLPIDYDYPADRIDYMLQDSGAAMLLTQERLSAKLTAKPDLVFCLDRDWPLMESYSRTNLPSLINGENLAYVIYTSGSTGQPKATEVPHRSIAGFIFGVDYASFDPQCVLLQHSSVNWDAMTLELWPALLRGGRTVLLPNKIVTGADLRTCIHKYGLNTLWLTSALFNLIVEEDPESLKGIRQLMIGGEALSVPHVKRILRSIPEIRIVNGYGPSECTVFSNCYPIRETPGEDVQSIPIGPAIGDRRVYLLDQWLNPVPVGVMGEIYIGGPSVARGYSNQPVMTAEKFIPDCFSVQPGERLYRTGDLARWKADGNLEFAGRADGQLKIRGFRVEPGETEAVLRKYPGVRDCAVVGRADHNGSNKRLIAYVAGEITSSELRQYAKEKFPEYMIPSVFVVLPKLPLNANGKVDRQALPVVIDPGEEQPRNYVAPRMVVEEVLADIWSEVLQLKRIGVEDNFFDLGGHSLLAQRVISRINSYFQSSLTIRDIFKSSAIGDLAQALIENAGRPLAEIEKMAKAILKLRRMTLAEKTTTLERLRAAAH